MDTALTELVVRTCLAVRQGLIQDAAVGFGELVAAERATSDKASWLRAVEICLVAAARGRQEVLLQGWLRAVESLIWESKSAEAYSLVPAKGELLLKLTFAVCDKQLESTKPQLARLWHRWLGKLALVETVDASRAFGTAAQQEELADAKQSAVSSQQEEQRLCGELLNLAARMARRGWRGEARFVLRIVAWAALKDGPQERKNALPLWQSIMARLSLHFTVYARWDGFTKACQVYYELVLLLLLLVRRSERAALSIGQRAAYLQLALRTVRDLVTNIARSTMQEDMDIFRQWYQYLWQLAGEDVARKQRLLLLLQLSISYWHSTLPKSSKKQLRFLRDLLEPSYISAGYETLLRRIA